MGQVGTLRRLSAGAVTITAVTLLALFASSLAGASKVEPVPGPDNPQASDCPSGSTGWKYEPVATANGVGDGTLWSTSRSTTPPMDQASTGARIFRS